MVACQVNHSEFFDVWKRLDYDWEVETFQLRTGVCGCAVGSSSACADCVIANEALHLNVSTRASSASHTGWSSMFVREV